MQLNDFLSKVRKLHCLDFYDLVQGGAMDQNDPRWGTFRSDPVGFLLRADDLTAERIWAVASKVRESHG